MRVLYLNPFSQQVSGPDESLLALLERLIPLGVEPQLVLPAPGPQVARYERLGVRVHVLPISALKRSLRPRDLARFGLRLGRGALAVARLARRERIQLVHTNMEVVLDGALAARRLGLPHVLHYRGNTLDEPKPVFDALTRLWTGLSDRVFCISGSTAEIFRKRGLMEKVEVLYNPVDLGRFGAARRQAEVRAALGAPGDELLVATVGRIHPRKDVETFVRACAQVAGRFAQARFAVVGPAEAPEELEYERRVRALATELGLEGRLTWAGARRDMPQVLAALDVFVLCSRHEGFGRVVAEAMAAGLPQVVSREGALPELVREGQEGLQATPADPADFARALASLLGDAERRAAMGQAGRARAAQFDAGRVAERVWATYRALARARS